MLAYAFSTVALPMQCGYCFPASGSTYVVLCCLYILYFRLYALFLLSANNAVASVVPLVAEVVLPPFSNFPRPVFVAFITSVLLLTLPSRPVFSALLHCALFCFRGAVAGLPLHFSFLGCRCPTLGIPALALSFAVIFVTLCF